MPNPTGTSGGGPKGGLPVGTKAPKAKDDYTYTPWVQDPDNKLRYERVGTKTVTIPGKKVTKFAKDRETYLASFKNSPKDQGLYNKYKNDPTALKVHRALLSMLIGKRVMQVLNQQQKHLKIHKRLLLVILKLA